MNWLDNALIEQLGLSLLHFLWQGALIGLIYGATLPATRGSTARTRYNIAVLTLAALAAAPAVTLALLLHSGSPATAPTTGTGTESVLLSVQFAGDGAPQSAVMQWVVAAWLVGVALLTARLLLGWRFLRRLRRSADFAAAEPIRPRLLALVQRLGIERPVSIAVSTGIRSPVVIGWLKPLVLLPPAILAGLPTRQLEMVLAHELAHVRRLDHLVNLCQTVIETVLFYHPVVRWVSRRIRVERENACDDLAVAVTDDRLAYVEMLASLEKLRFAGPRLALAVHDGQMLHRIRRLVERGRPDRQLGLTGPALLAGLLLAAAGSLQLMDDELDRKPVADPAPDSPASASTGGAEPVIAETGPSSSPEHVAGPAASGVGVSRQAASVTHPGPSESQRVAASDNAAAEAVSAAGPGSENPDRESRPPALPVMETDRLPPVSELIEQQAGRELARVERPALATPRLPEPPRRTSPKTDDEALTGGQLIERVEPDYPGRARRNGIDGSVEVEFLVNRDGSVSDIRVVEERPRGASFGESARDAIAHWRFEPFRQGGEPIDRRVRVEVGFGLASEDERECRDVLGSRIPRCH